MIPVPYHVQRALNDVWRSVDALGGSHSQADHENGYAKAYDDAVDAALEAVSGLGGVRT